MSGTTGTVPSVPINTTQWGRFLSAHFFCFIGSAFSRGTKRTVPFGQKNIPVLDGYLFAVVFSVEFFNPAGCVDYLLDAGEKGMAVGANVNPDILLGGAGFKLSTAGASGCNFVILGMNIFLHTYDLPPKAVAA